MQDFYLTFAVVLLLICPGRSSKAIQTCNQTIHISCVPYQFILVHSNGTTSLTANILKKCNSHQECQVPNPGRECVQLAYLRRKEQQHTFQIEEASNLDQYKKLSLFSLMSEGYREAHSMNASNISCSLKLSNGGDTSSKNMSIEIYEFASYTNVSDYCLYMNNTEKPLVCSGSKTIYQSHGPFNSRNGWQWSMKLVNTQIQMPKVRFWIGIIVSPNDESMYHLECHSQPVSTRKKSELTPESPKTVDAFKKALYMALIVGGALVLTGIIWSFLNRMGYGTQSLPNILEHTVNLNQLSATHSVPYRIQEREFISASRTREPIYQEPMLGAVSATLFPTGNNQSSTEVLRQGDLDDETTSNYLTENEYGGLCPENVERPRSQTSLLYTLLEIRPRVISVHQATDASTDRD